MLARPCKWSRPRASASPAHALGDDLAEIKHDQPLTTASSAYHMLIQTAATPSRMVLMVSTSSWHSASVSLPAICRAARARLGGQRPRQLPPRSSSGRLPARRLGLASRPVNQASGRSAARRRPPTIRRRTGRRPRSRTPKGGRTVAGFERAPDTCTAALLRDVMSTLSRTIRPASAATGR